MTHFGVVSPAFFSHVSALQALGGELAKRGHTVTFFNQADARPWVTDDRLDYRAVGLKTHPSGSLAGVIRRAARPGPLGLRKIIADMAFAADMLCRALPHAVSEAPGEAAVTCLAPQS